MWKDLTMSQRADMMDLYLSKGITSLDDMRSLYDSSISDTAQGTSFSDGGSIHIKPENRGKFTALKERTGHSATWFKEYGTPDQKKMATFALNARHWKHGDGGNLYLFGGYDDNNPRPVTTGGAGYIPTAPQVNMKPIVNLPKSVNEARLRLYNMVSPAWGFTDDTIKATMDTMLHGTNDFVDSPVGTKVSDPYVDGVWAEYLQIPKNKRRSSYQLQKSSYRPTVGDASNVTYYTIPVDANTKARLVREGTALQTGKNKNSRVLANYNSGTHTIGRGRDSKGDYVSYYDRFDLNPFSGISSETSLSNNPVIKALGLDSSKVGDLSFGLGKPLEFYDRIYLDDYYNVPSPYRGSSYLPEVTITGKKRRGKKHGYGGHIYDGTSEDTQQMNTPRYRKLLDAEIKEELSDNDVMELPLAAELSDVRVTGKKKRNVFSQIEEKWIKNDKGEEVPTYWGYNPDTKQKEQLYRLEDGKSSDESVFFTPDGRWSYNVPQAAEMRKAYEQWIKNGAYASGIDEAVLGYLLFGVSPIALPEIAAGALTPVGQTLLAGTLGGEAWEALNHGITGQSWGDNLGDVIGLDKDNYLGRTALGLTNPFYGLSPSMIYRGGEAVLGAGKTALNLAQNTASKSVEALQNKYPALFDPYTSWDATLGYHGDNIFNRAVGTIGRKHGYTPRAEVPEFHRRLDINRPEEFRLTDDGKFVISSGRTGDGHDGIVNFATSEPARGHGNHRRLSGTDDYIINPKVIGNQDFKSIQPSDTFFETGELTINPKDVTIVSGNTNVLDHARSMGMKTLSSPKLRQLTAKRVTKEEIVNDRAKDGILKFIRRAQDLKYGKGKENLESIGKEIQRLTSMRGAPTMRDYAYFEDMTGLNSGVRPAEMWNGTEEQGLELFGDWGTPLNAPSFNHVAYTPASSIESIYRGAKMGERPWSDYYEALEKMPSARQQLGQ